MTRADVALLALLALAPACADDEGRDESDGPSSSSSSSSSSASATSSSSSSSSTGGLDGPGACDASHAKLVVCGVALESDPTAAAPCWGFNACVARCTNAASCAEILELLDDTPAHHASPYVACVDACLAATGDPS